MTFRLATHSVFTLTFKSLRAFKTVLKMYFRWGTKDSLLSYIPPRNLVSSTAGIGLLSRKSCISKAIVSCPLLKFIQTKLQLTFDNTHAGRSVALKIIDI